VRTATALLAALLAIVLTGVLAGCAAPHRARFLPARLDRGIERYDFANASWQSDAGRVTLHGGHATLPPADPTEPVYDPQTADITRGPVFSDIDGDGAEDAAIELHQGGQGYTIAWYVWLWRHGTAVQQTEPFVDFSRCSGQVDRVTAVPGGFRVEQRFADLDLNPCSIGGVVPITYTVAMRAGFLVQVAPVLGQLPCDPNYLTAPVTVPGPVTPRAAAGDRAPAITTAHRYPRAWIGEYELPSSHYDKPWMDVLLDDGTNPPFCGWLHTTDVQVTG
jgi:hypothetical protein